PSSYLIPLPNDMHLPPNAKKPPPTKEESVYDPRHSSIMRCHLTPGHKLVIDSLSDELGVSPIPVRSALQRLQSEGLVDITPHTGTRVSEISPETVNEIFLLLESLETAAFQVCATKVTDADIDQLQQIVDSMALALRESNAHQWYDLNNKFHLAIAQMTGMNMLVRFTTRALNSRDRLRYFYSDPFTSDRMTTAHAEHGQMIVLLQSKDVEGLAKIAAQHNRSAKAAYHKLIEQQKKNSD
ncbi:MAG: GntR family transcriptional regulator, partial [Chloroflexota bacterium]